MEWTVVSITTAREAGEAVSEMLMSAGAGGVEIYDPEEIRQMAGRLEADDYVDFSILAPEIKNGTDLISIKAYLPSKEEKKETEQLFKKKIEYISNIYNQAFFELSISSIKDEDWMDSWKKYYKSFNITDRIIVKPSWEEIKPCGDDIIIQIDPGMAFGTGLHESTRLCAQLMQQILRAGNKVIDIGCGTGILSIIAAKLGASGVKAVDIDKAAVTAAKENCRLNNVLRMVDVLEGTVQILPGDKAHVAVANIIAKVIVEIWEDIKLRLKTGGFFIASGIIREKTDYVIRHYESKGFKLMQTLSEGEWVAILFKCQDFT